MPDFNKYRERGAYHWDHLRRHLSRHHCFTAARYRLVLKAAGVRSHEAVVDVGCGDGALLALLARKGKSWMGVEPEAVGRCLAVEKLAAAGLRGEVVAAIKDVPREHADVVVLAEVIEHIENVRGLLEDIAGMMKRGGRLVVTTPIRMTEIPRDKEHVREFFPTELVDCLKEHFEVTRQITAMPALAVELYTWRPRVLGRLPLVRYLMNAQSVFLGRSWLESECSRLPTHQIVVCKKV